MFVGPDFDDLYLKRKQLHHGCERSFYDPHHCVHSDGLCTVSFCLTCAVRRWSWKYFNECFTIWQKQFLHRKTFFSVSHLLWERFHLIVYFAFVVKLIRVRSSRISVMNYLTIERYLKSSMTQKVPVCAKESFDVGLNGTRSNFELRRINVFRFCFVFCR